MVQTCREGDKNKNERTISKLWNLCERENNPNKPTLNIANLKNRKSLRNTRNNNESKRCSNAPTDCIRDHQSEYLTSTGIKGPRTPRVCVIRRSGGFWLTSCRFSISTTTRMKLCLALVTLVAVSHAASISYLMATPTLRTYPYVYGSHATSVITPVQQQYHTQDELGQYAYGYSDPLSSKQEVRSLDGVTRGSYSYRDADGILQTVDYTADDTGFHVTATNLPKPVVHQSQFQASESPVSYTVSSMADTTNSISSDTDTESIASAGPTDNEIYSRSGLRLAEHTTSHAKSLPAAAHVRSMELSKSVADTLKMAPSTGVYVSGQPRNVVLTRPLAVAGIPVTAKSLLQKVYGFGYPLSKQFIYY